MINENEANGEKGLYARTVKAFLEHFQGTTFPTIMKSSCWWETVNNIVGRAQTGKLMLSPTRQQHIDKQIAFHLGQLAREFRASTFDENLVENIDETHCKVNLDNDKTLGFRGDNDVKYADVVSGGMGMTLMIRLTGGPHARIYNPCVIFQNASESYPIRRVPNDVPGVCYRMTKKGFITQKLWA
ncbi:hypothetical protein CY35_20G010900 [Sphagnum magellanicum]|nr:hypothetical protein CY35_20G010900 [Sphagnum magellanicum]